MLIYADVCNFRYDVTGSAYYHTHDNFFVYGGNGMKNDFGGHDNYHTDNLYAYVGEAIGFYDAPMLAGQ